VAPARLLNPWGSAADAASAIRDAGSIRGEAARRGVAPGTVKRWIDELGVTVVEPRKPRVEVAGLIPTPEPWQGPRARLVEPACRPGATSETVAFISDIHYPYHDATALGSALAVIRHVKPDRVVLNGDGPDFFGISSHNRTMERLDTLQAEVDGMNQVRRAIRWAAPNAVIDETEGNHDSRLRTFVRQQARQLASLRALDPANLNNWSEVEFTPYGTAGFLLRPYFVVRHGTVVRPDAGASARGEMKKAKLSGASGHTHRLGKAAEQGYRPMEWYEGGCLCQLDPDYVDGPPNWTHGFLLGEFSTRSEAFVVDEVKTFEGLFRYGGRRFEPVGLES
jgi:hypothetical protein